MIKPMPITFSPPKYKGLIKATLVALLLLTITLLYYPGINGAFYYDDVRPLSPLATITNLESALVYISSESSGPLGRPIAMLSFLVNSNDWPSATSTGNISAFFSFNVFLHLANGLLVFLLTYFIAKLYQGEKKANYWLAITVSAFWLVLPIQVSTSLIAIQRMAGLSAFFVFSGLLLYSYGLYKQSVESSNNIHNNHGLPLQFIGLIAFTLLAMFSKENGALLPIFVLVLEITLLANVPTIQYRRKLRISACTAGLMTLLLYLAYLTFNTRNELPHRDFTLIERLLTQPQILVEYLHLAFIPDITAFSPFHDNYQQVSNLLSSKKAILSILLLLGLLSSALYYRLKQPLFAFAVLWFFAAHLLESTVISLELYFEHRNYVALFGPCLALIFTFTKVKKRYQNLAVISFSLYWLLLCACLLLTTQLWGQPHLAAQIWQAKQVGSARATAYLSNIYLQAGKIESAQQLLAKHISECDSCTSSQAISLFFSCYSGEKQATEEAYHALLYLSQTTKNARGVAASLTQVHKLITNDSCQYLSLTELKTLNTAFLQLPKSSFNKKLPFLQNLYAFALNEQNRNEAIRLLYLAWHEQADDIIANELVSMLIASQQTIAAQYFIKEQVCQRTSLNPIIAKVKKEHCEYLSQSVKSTIEKNNRIGAEKPATNFIEINDDN
ncbi:MULTISPECIES: hypothetical protein [Colwellia]|nr:MULTISPECIES: hypothetical protein [Colwellia]